MIGALCAGAIDAVVDDDVALVPLVGDDDLAIAFTVATRNAWGVAVAKDRPEVRSELDSALARIIADGRLQATWRRWMGSLAFPLAPAVGGCDERSAGAHHLDPARDRDDPAGPDGQCDGQPASRRVVVAAGGIPVATDMWADPDQLVARVDALVINGGVDVDAGRYGAIRHPSSDAPQSRRDGFELGLIAAAQERGLPIVGICRGLHLLNVARGGTLHQHLPDVTDLVHYVTDPYDRPAHEIAIEPGSRVAAALGRRAAVNSVHHQGVDRLGSGLAVSARAPDGTIEAIEDPDRPLIGVQWHPEFLVGRPAPSRSPSSGRSCAHAPAPSQAGRRRRLKPITEPHLSRWPHDDDEPAIPYFDLSDPAFSIRSDEVRAAREQSWYARTNYGIAVLRYDEVNRLMKDRRGRQGSRQWPALNDVTGPWAQWWLKGCSTSRPRPRAAAPPVAPGVLPKHIQALVPSFQVLANELIDDFVDAGECEFVSQFSDPYAAGSSRSSSGSPSANGRSSVTTPMRSDSLSGDHQAGPTADRGGAGGAVRLRGCAARRPARASRRRPRHPPGAGPPGRGRLSLDELRVNVVLMIFGGIDTTAISWGSPWRRSPSIRGSGSCSRGAPSSRTPRSRR